MYCVPINSEEIKAAIPIARRLRLSTSERIIAWRLATCPLASNQMLAEALWGGDDGPTDEKQAVKSIIASLRRKLGSSSNLVQCHLGHGYFTPKHGRARFLDLLAREIAEVRS